MRIFLHLGLQGLLFKGLYLLKLLFFNEILCLLLLLDSDDLFFLQLRSPSSLILGKRTVGLLTFVLKVSCAFQHRFLCDELYLLNAGLSVSEFLRT
jgi:hypothetical protein